MATHSPTPHRILLAAVGLVAVLGGGAVAYGATVNTPATSTGNGRGPGRGTGCVRNH